MAILIKLLAIKMVANSCLGLFFSLSSLAVIVSSSFSRLSRSLGDREKNATSDPETRAEQINRHNRTKPVETRLHTLIKRGKRYIDKPRKRAGSGSKVSCFVSKSYA